MGVGEEGQKETLSMAQASCCEPVGGGGDAMGNGQKECRGD